tara:strand:+ start:2865 stop:3338 length:474 start_codon:yes stop_codon:yes gene_type:complete
MIQTGVNVTSNDSSAQIALGTIYEAAGGKKYKYVELRNETATVAGAIGDVVGYLGSPSASENNTVVTDNSDAATKPVGAGVLGVAVVGTLAVAEYVWVQVSGPFTAGTNLAGTPADGDAVFLSTTDLTLTLATAVDDPICAYVIDDSADKCMAAFAY